MCYKSMHHPHWKKHYAKHWRAHLKHGQIPPVNVKETDTNYQILVYAAGYQKADFQVSIEDETLVISVAKDAGVHLNKEEWRRQEFSAGAFERQFELNEKIDKSNVQAAYQEGVLTITLPKLPGFETIRQDIQIG